METRFICAFTSVESWHYLIVSLLCKGGGRDSGLAWNFSFSDCRWWNFEIEKLDHSSWSAVRSVAAFNKTAESKRTQDDPTWDRMGHRTQRWGWIGIRCVWCSHPKLLVGRIEGSRKMKKEAVAVDFKHFQWGLQKLIWSLEPLSSWATLPRHIGIAPCKGRCCAHGALF